MKKLIEYLKVALAAIGRFLRYTYASQIIILLEATLIYGFISKFLGIVFFVAGVLFFINELKQPKI
jgi:hypothetical protein